MPLAALRDIPENHRVCVVCVDSYERKELQGRFRHLAAARERNFESAMEFLCQLEELQNGLGFPQRTTEGRTFCPAGARRRGALALEECACADIQPLHGGLATFQVRVIFRQNSSWQGSILWAETGLKRDFRSALELLFLIDDALTAGRESWQDRQAE